MTELFGRVCTLEVGSFKWTDLRVVFRVDRSLTKSPNPAQITIYNLSEGSRRAIDQEGLPVRLIAGYNNAPQTVFIGDLQRLEVTKDGADIATRIIARDGGTSWTRNVSRSLSGGNLTLLGAVSQLSQVMGTPLDATSQAALKGIKLRRALALRGQAAQSLDVLLRSAGYEWSIQSGSLQVLQSGAALPTRAVLLSPSTGLVGVPEQQERKKGWIVQSLLQPKIAPGVPVVLQSLAASGQYRARRVVHSGDTHGPGQWTTEIELR